MTEIQVYKFGGASVKDADGIRNLKEIVELNREKKILIVVSAIDKTTNKLEELTKLYRHADPAAEQVLATIRKYHDNILSDLFDAKHPIFDDIANVFVEIEWILEEECHPDAAFVYDQIVSIGELVSTRIVSAYLQYSGLNNKWVDARNYIQTDNTYKEGIVNWHRTKSAIQKDLPSILNDQFIVTQGFIGGTSENYSTTLGREGSDYSAAIFATCLDAAAVTIWKDVPGVLNADPKIFTDTVKYPELSYLEALEMAYFGATVIHPKTIKPLKNANIPLFVKPFKSPNENGTKISSDATITDYIPAIIVKENQTLVSISSKDFSFISEEHLSIIFSTFSTYRVKINAMQLSAISFTVCFDSDDNSAEALFKALGTNYQLKYNNALQLITVRHYEQKTLDKLCSGKTVLLQQLSRNTAQMVLKQ